MTSDRCQNNYTGSAGSYNGMQNLYPQPGQAHGNGQYLTRSGFPMSPHLGAGDVHYLASNMGAMNLHASYGSGSTTKSGGTLNSSDFGGIPIGQGQGLWVPN